jgi:hypothetical protein
MSRNKSIVINNYKKYWISDTAQGHLIKICHGNNDQVLEIDLRWSSRKRDKQNRVVNDICLETPKILRRVKTKT